MMAIHRPARCPGLNTTCSEPFLRADETGAGGGTEPKRPTRAGEGVLRALGTTPNQIVGLRRFQIRLF